MTHRLNPRRGTRTGGSLLPCFSVLPLLLCDSVIAFAALILSKNGSLTLTSVASADKTCEFIASARYVHDTFDNHIVTAGHFPHRRKSGKHCPPDPPRPRQRI